MKNIGCLHLPGLFPPAHDDPVGRSYAAEQSNKAQLDTVPSDQTNLHRKVRCVAQFELVALPRFEAQIGTDGRVNCRWLRSHDLNLLTAARKRHGTRLKRLKLLEGRFTDSHRNR
jgi:hypothetical protein